MLDELILLVQKTYGLVGLLILAPVGACVMLFRENQKLHREQLATTAQAALDIKVANETALEAQKMRVTDAQNVAQRLLENMTKQTELASETNTVLKLLNQDLNRR